MGYQFRSQQICFDINHILTGKYHISLYICGYFESLNIHST